MSPGPIRVLHVVKGLGPGGAERLLVSLAAVSDRSAVEHTIAYVVGVKSHLVPELHDLGVHTHLLAGPAGMRDLRWPARLRRVASAADVVHLHSPSAAVVARSLLRTLRPRPAIVSTEHARWPSYHAATRVGNALTVPFDDARWAVSQGVVDSMWEPWRANVEVLTHGVPASALRARRSERAASREEHGWSDDDVVVVTVANLHAMKDYPTLLAAARQALEVEPRLRFVSVGQGPLEAELRRQVEALGVGDRIRLLGYRADPARVLAGADVFTLTSTHEGLPVAVLEALALGLPCVVTAVGGVPEAVTDGAQGVVVPPRRPDLLASAYVDLARDEHRRATLAAAALERSDDFDIARTARTLEARYRQVAG